MIAWVWGWSQFSFFSAKQTCKSFPHDLFLFTFFYEKEQRHYVKMLCIVSLRLLSGKLQIIYSRTCCICIVSYS